MNQMEKFLKVEDQSFVLCSIIFSPDLTDKLVSFLPSMQARNILESKKSFLSLSQTDSLLAIKELKRLIFLDSFNFDSFHLSWIKHALRQEPPYIRKKLFVIWKKSKRHDALSLDENIFLESFFSAFDYAKPKIARYDLVLIKLQELADDKNRLMAFLNFLSMEIMYGLSKTLNEKRFSTFLKRKNISLNQKNDVGELSFLKINLIKKEFLKLLLEKNFKLHFIAMLAIALYFKCLKNSWHKSIAYSLPMEMGQLLLDFTRRITSLEVEEKLAQEIGAFLTEKSKTF